MTALAGLRIVSFALNVPGPVAVARLVAHGGAATKVEPPSGDPLSVYSRAWYDTLHAHVTVVTLDLKSDAGRMARDVLLGAADVAIMSSRPSALARLGLGPARLAERFPGLRTVSIVGDTAAPEHPGHDVTYQAEAGLLHDRLPVTLLADLAGAERVVTTVLLALHSAPGAWLQVGLHDVLDGLRAPLAVGLTTPGGRFGGGDPAYGVYAARDGHVAVAALEPHFRARLYDGLCLPIDTPLADMMASRACADWAAFAREHDLPIAVVRPPT